MKVGVGRGVLVGFASPTGNQDGIWLSCEVLGLPRMAADTEEPAPGQKAQTAIRQRARVRSNNGMVIRVPDIVFGGICREGSPFWMIGVIGTDSPALVEVV